MNIKCGKVNISDYDFLRLLTSSIILKKQSPIIKNHKLEKDLYNFYSKPEYHYLFEDICKKEDIFCENNYVDLGNAFQHAYAFGLLTQIHDSYSELRSIINLSDKDARKIQSQYSLNQIQSINNLCNEMLEEKETKAKQVNVLVKTKN